MTGRFKYFNQAKVEKKANEGGGISWGTLTMVYFFKISFCLFVCQYKLAKRDNTNCSDKYKMYLAADWFHWCVLSLILTLESVKYG